MITKEVMKKIKSYAIAAGVTQVDIAEELNVSLPTVKRWYQGKGIGLDQLAILCTFLGADLAEVIKSVDESQRSQFYYTEAQERFFSKSPDSLAFFDNLLRGKSVKQIQRKFSLSDMTVNKVLLALDKLALIELHAGNKVKLLLEGEPVWRVDGELSKKFRSVILNDFLKQKSEEEKFILCDLLDDDVQTLKGKMQDVNQFITSSIKRASMYPERAKSYGFYFQLKKFTWSVDQFLKNR